jgi:beta-galactosidase
LPINDFEDRLDFYPYGVQYYRQPTPLPDEWAADLAEIARVGYTHIQLRPQWIWHERIRGRFEWDDLDRLFDLARANGLRVILKPMLETAPDWVYSELNGYRIGFHSIPIDPIGHGCCYPGGWLPCFDNPDVAEAAQRFVRELVTRYKDHPALWFYDAWNEPRSRPAGQCQCRHSVFSYRKWLQCKFGTIEQMNAALGKAYTSFETIRPPQSAADYIELFLWRQWATWTVSEHVRLVTDTIKSIHRDAFVMVHVGMCQVINDSVCDSTNDALNSTAADRYGTSFPINLHPTTLGQHCIPDIISDWIRHFDDRYWCHEFYPTEGNWCRLPRPEKLMQLIWMAIAGGAAGFTFWQYRSERVGNEANCSGLREIDGSPTERSQVADAIGRILRQYGSKLVGTRRARSKVAELFSTQSDLVSRIQSISAPELALEPTIGSYFYKRAIQSAHCIYSRGGETVDWVTSGEDLSGYELLVVPAAEMVDFPTALWLRAYVEGGGILVVEFPFACRDDNTWVSRKRPNHGLDELLGCVEAERVISIGDEATFFDGLTIRAFDWRIVLEPTTGEPIAHWQDGAIAAVRNSFGKGIVYALGASPSLSWADSWDDPACKISHRILDEAGVTCDSPDDVFIRRRIGESHEVWFVFNIAECDRSITLPHPPTAIWQGSEYPSRDLTVTLPPNAVFIAELSRT